MIFRRKEMISLIKNRDAKGFVGFVREMGGFLE